MRRFPASEKQPRICGFTLPEVLVVMAVIALLIGVLVPALSGAFRTSQMTSSMNKLKQISLLMRQYSTENREYIVPSQFDYSQSAGQGYPVKVRSYAGLGPLRYQGTWTDILWVFNGMGVASALDTTGKYQYDSPDRDIYDLDSTYDANPFRAAAANSRDYHPASGDDGIPTPFGGGAHEAGIAGFFAANDFFNSRPDAPAAISPTPGGAAIPTPSTGRWYVTGQIKSPDKSMYVVDSLAGETIAPIGGATSGPWYNPEMGPPVDFQPDLRYNGSCLMLFLDGHVATTGRWKNLAELEGQVTVGGAVTNGRNIRISQLTRSGLPWVP